MSGIGLRERSGDPRISLPHEREHGAGGAKHPRAGVARRWSQLDGLRCVAVSLVMWEHFRGSAPSLGAGAFGVYTFFVLSGFLITNILLGCRDRVDEGSVTVTAELRRFYVRRVLRIFPLYYLALAVFAAAGVWHVRETLPWTGSYLTNLYFIRRGAWDGAISHFWSLAVEEQFYLVWPLVILMAPRQWLPRIAATCIALGVLSKLLMCRTSFVASLVSPVSCLDTLGAGAALAMYQRGLFRHSFPCGAVRIVRLAAVPLATAGVLLMRDGTAEQWAVFGLASLSLAAAIGAAWIVSLCVRSSPITRWLSLRPLVYIGTISYGIYVWHNFMPWAMAVAHRHAPWLPMSSTILPLLAIATAAASFHLFESPILELKRFFDYGSPVGRPSGRRRGDAVSPAR